MSNTYLSAHDYKAASTGQETASLIGNLMRVGTAGIAQGATSLPVTPATTVDLAVYDNIYVFDGANSEVLQVTAIATHPVSTITVSAAQFAHVGGVSLVTDGAQGSLGQTIFDTCAELERITHQALLQATYTNEVYDLKTSRAWIDNNGQLGMRPFHFPVTSVTGLQLEPIVGDILTLDAAQVIIQQSARQIKAPVIKNVGAGGNFTLLTSYASQTTAGNILLTYQAGYVYSALPYQIRRAAIWLVSDFLSDRVNPTGAAETKIGNVQRVAYLRGDNSGESVLYKRAVAMLLSYTQKTI